MSRLSTQSRVIAISRLSTQSRVIAMSRLSTGAECERDSLLRSSQWLSQSLSVSQHHFSLFLQVSPAPHSKGAAQHRGPASQHCTVAAPILCRQGGEYTCAFVPAFALLTFLAVVSSLTELFSLQQLNVTLAVCGMRALHSLNLWAESIPKPDSVG